MSNNFTLDGLDSAQIDEYLKLGQDFLEDDYALNQENQTVTQEETDVNFNETDFPVKTEQQTQQEEQSQIYNSQGKETGIVNSHNEKLSVGETLEDIGKATWNEFTRVFKPKELEDTYDERTNAAHNARMLYRYGVSFALALIPWNIASKATIAAAVALKLPWLTRVGKAIQAADKVKLLGEGSKGLKALKLAGIATDGMAAEAISGWNVYRPEEGEGHFADIFESKEYLNFLQSRDDDTDTEARLKEVINNAFIAPFANLGMHFIVAPAFKTLFSKFIKHNKQAVKAITEQEAEEAAAKIIADSAQFENVTTKQELFERVVKIREEALERELDFEDVLKEKGIQGEYFDDAMAFNKMLANGEKPFIYEDGTIGATITKWDNAADLTDEQFTEQLKALDDEAVENAKIQKREQLDRELTTEEVQGIEQQFLNSSVINFQDKAVEDTWKQRGLLGENESLIKYNENTDKRTINKQALTSIVNHYVDKFKIGNKVRVKFVDGLAAEGQTVAAKNTGKTAKNLKNKIDKQKLKIQQLEDKITQLEGGNAEVSDPLDVLKEQLRIAKSELKDLETFLPDIDITIDLNAQNPYATLRSELEHANDIAHNKVPKDENHFSRYQGRNEGEVAQGFVKHKADRKKEILSGGDDGVKVHEVENTENPLNTTENVVKSDKEIINGQRTDTTNTESRGLATDRSTDRTSIEGLSKSYERRSYNGSKRWLVETTHSLPDNIKTELNAKGIDTPDFHQLQSGNDEMAGVFYNALKKAKELDPKGMASVDLHSPKKYKNMKMFLSENEDCGFVIKPDGDLISVFSYSKGTGRNKSLMPLAIAQGAKKLDCYDTYLPKLYENFGFKAVKRDKWNEKHKPKDWDKEFFKKYNNGEPDVVYMELKKETQTGTPVKADKPEQLKLDLDFSTVTPKQAAEAVVNGKSADVGDIAAMVDNIIKNDEKLSSFKWKDIADNADMKEQLVKMLSDKNVSQDLSKAYLNGDVKTVADIMSKQLAANKAISLLYDQLQDLGLNASKEQRKSIMESVQSLQKYVKSIGSAAGGFLNAQKLNIRAKNTFGKLPFNTLVENGGVSKIADLLSKKIKEYYDLKFTRNDTKDLQTVVTDFVYEMCKDKGLLKFYRDIAEIPDFQKKVYETIYTAFRKGESQSKIETALMELIADLQYEKAYKIAQLAPDKDSWFKTACNYVYKNTGAYYIHNLLSGVGSTFRNITSGALNTVYYPLRKIVAGSLCGGGKRLTQEGLLTFVGLKDSFNEAWQLGVQAFLKGEGKFSDFTQETVEQNLSNVVQGFNEWNFKDGSLENIFKQIQNFHSLMTRVMGASDEFMSQLNYRAMARAKSILEARSVAANDFINPTEEQILEQAEIFFKDKFDKTSNTPKDFELYNEAKEMLYQNSLSGMSYNPETGNKELYKDQTWAMAIGDAINKAANKTPPLKVLFPFIKSGVNILQMNLEHNLIYLTMSKTYRDKLLYGTPAEKAMIRAKAAFGTMSMVMGGMLATTGEITGSAPADADERKALFATGWKPYSIKAGGKYISYQGIEPLHTILGFSADCVQLATRLEDYEKDNNFNDFYKEGIAAVVNNFLDKAAFRTGLRQLQYLTDPNEFEVVEKSITQTAQGFLPDVAMVKGISTFGDREVKKPRMTYERLFNNYFNRGLGDTRRDVFGNSQSMTNLIVTQLTPDNTDLPEYAELEYLGRLGFNPTEVKEILDGTGIKMSDFINPQTKQSAYDAVQERLSKMEINGQTLQEAVRELVTSDEYLNKTEGVSHGDIRYSATDDTRINAIRKVFVKYNNKARQEIIDEYKDNSFVNSKGQTLNEAFEDIQMLKTQELEDSGGYETTEEWLMNF